MKNFLTAFSVFIIWSVFGLWIYSWIQPESIAAKPVIEIPVLKKNQKPVQEEKVIIEPEIATSNNQTKADFETKKDTISLTIPIEKLKFSATNSQGDIIFLFKEGISITKNIKEVFPSDGSKDYKYKINSFLIEHPNQEVHIYSIYSPQENVSTPNIGIQRAQEVEKKLVAIGVPPEKIVKKSIIKNSIFTKEEHYSNGFFFTFEELDIERVNKIINSKPKVRIVYPKFSESGVEVNNGLKKLLIDLKQYFKDYPNKKVDIVGHTDSVGNSSDNYTIGLKYAQHVKWYLVNKGGIDKSLIIASSKGELEPLESNESRPGRNYNRRIEVIFK
jgi:outer membrane protein OmpA-like peptidoglycan-associated protein